MLIDAGLPGKRIEERLEAVGLAPSMIQGVVVTHEHRDHSSGVGVWARRYKVPLYATDQTLGQIERVMGPGTLKNVEVRPFEVGGKFTVGELEFTPFSTSHDAACSVGFRIADGSAILGFATDLGTFSGETRAQLSDSRILYLESNHEMEMLLAGPYPWFLKNRIRSEKGHLSNEECAGLVGELLHDKLETVILAHLSETNNEPRLAFDRISKVLERNGAGEDVKLLVARQDRPGRIVRAA